MVNHQADTVILLCRAWQQRAGGSLRLGQSLLVLRCLDRVPINTTLFLKRILVTSEMQLMGQRAQTLKYKFAMVTATDYCQQSSSDLVPWKGRRDIMSTFLTMHTCACRERERLVGHSVSRNLSISVTFESFGSRSSIDMYMVWKPSERIFCTWCWIEACARPVSQAS